MKVHAEFDFRSARTTPPMRTRPAMRLLLQLIAIQTCISITSSAVASSIVPIPTEQSQAEDIRRWLDRLPDEDRAAADSGIGFAMPEFPNSLRWLEGRPFQSMQDMSGRVLVVQTWTCATAKGRSAPRRVLKSLRGMENADDVMVVMLHTPEGVDRAEAYCEKTDMPFSVALDSDGSACDLMGAFKRPVNFVIDREGELRYAGLSDRGLRAAVEKVVAEEFDDSSKPPARPEPNASTDESDSDAQYPATTTPVGSARDLRGKPAPEFAVERWITREPDARGKVAIVDFWATWCGPCIKSIPHMNDLANDFRGQVECVGISDEKFDAFEKGFERANLDGSQFAYSLALDSQGRMKNAFQIRGIPHVAVISTDWVVRWQGHPSRLTKKIVQQIIDADSGLRTGNTAGGLPGRPPARWSGSTSTRR